MNQVLYTSNCSDDNDDARCLRLNFILKINFRTLNTKLYVWGTVNENYV